MLERQRARQVQGASFTVNDLKVQNDSTGQQRGMGESSVEKQFDNNTNTATANT